MRIGNNFQINFKALLGKKEINRFQGRGIDKVTYIQHIHPFKDEYATEKDLETAVAKFEYGKFVNKFNKTTNGPYTVFKVKIEPTLPFTKDEFKFAENYPNSPEANQEAKKFIQKGEYNETIIKETAAFPHSIMIEDLS